MYDKNNMSPLDLITKQLTAGEDRKLLLQESINLLEKADPGSRLVLEDAFLSISLRAIETKILSDPELRRLALYWNIYRSNADEIIKDRITDLFQVESSEELKKYIKKCVKSFSSRLSGKEGISDSLVKEAIGEAIRVNPQNEIRCSFCGYHFRSNDLGKKRRFLVEEFNPVFADTIHPLRLVDKLKPWKLGNYDFTQLTIDHLTPEAGFGWTNADNLVVACSFCNQGKKIYRRSLESISTVIAGSLQACPAERDHSTPRHIAVFTAIFYHKICTICKSERDKVELTVDLRKEVKYSRWLAPWVLKVKCYNCLNEKL